MMHKKIHVGLLFGGRSGEHEVSLASAASVFKALDKSRYDVTLIGIDKEGRWLLPDVQKFIEAPDPMKFRLTATDMIGVAPFPSEKQLIPTNEKSQVSKIDVVIPILHGTYGEDGTIQGLLELAQIPYVGSGVLGSSVGMDKDVTARLLEQAGIPTVETLCLRKTEFLKNRSSVEKQLLERFAFPFFVKPANAGSSVGVHKVKNQDQLKSALEDAFSFDFKVLVQKGIQARELEVSVLGNDEPKASVVGEIVPRHEFYSYEAKYLDDNGAELLVPAKISTELSEKVRSLAVQAFQVLECKGFARVDFFLDRQTNELYLNEVNTIPGFTRISMYPKMWAASGLPYPQLLDELIRLALELHQQKHSLRTSI